MRLVCPSSLTVGNTLGQQDQALSLTEAGFMRAGAQLSCKEQLPPWIYLRPRWQVFFSVALNHQAWLTEDSRNINYTDILFMLRRIKYYYKHISIEKPKYRLNLHKNCTQDVLKTVIGTDVSPLYLMLYFKEKGNDFNLGSDYLIAICFKYLIHMLML